MAGRRINTFVVFDLETTGLPSEELNKTKITELAMVAVSRETLLSTPYGVPRVIHKFSLCFNPFRMISPTSTNITGLSNEMLEKERTFDKDACDLINLFLSRQIPPVCLVAHNGMRFDYPIMASEIAGVGKALPDDILCIDSLEAFQDLFSTIPMEMLPSYIKKRRAKSAAKSNDIVNETLTENDLSQFSEDRSFMQLMNERTPEQKKHINVPPQEVFNTIKAKRRLFTQDESDSPSQLTSFKLQDIFRFLSGKNVIDSHRAENDVLTLIACITIMGQDFMKWADDHAVTFNTVKRLR